MERTIKVIAIWDDKASVWVAHSRDVMGLALEAPTQDDLVRKLVAAIPDLIDLNGLVDDGDGSDVPIELLMRGQRRVTAVC